MQFSTFYSFTILTLLLLCVLTVSAEDEWVRQCTCTELAGCKDSVTSGLMPCAEQCKVGKNFNGIFVKSYDRFLEIM